MGTREFFLDPCPSKEQENRVVAELLTREIQRMQKQGHPLSSLVDPESTLSFLRAIRKLGGVVVSFVEYRPNSQTAVLAGALGYTIVPLWWSGQKNLKALNEEFVIGRVPGFGRFAVEYMEQMAKTSGASVVIAGNFLGCNPVMTKNLYVGKMGFQLQTNNFIKVVQ
nr:hypothetical protein [uncultured Anaeromusa sp.]